MEPKFVYGNPEFGKRIKEIYPVEHPRMMPVSAYYPEYDDHRHWDEVKRRAWIEYHDEKKAERELDQEIVDREWEEDNKDWEEDSLDRDCTT